MKGVVDRFKFNTDEDDIVFQTAYFGEDGMYVKEILYQQYWMGFFYLYRERNKLGDPEIRPRIKVKFLNDEKAHEWVERIKRGDITK